MHRVKRYTYMYIRQDGQGAIIRGSTMYLTIDRWCYEFNRKRIIDQIRIQWSSVTGPKWIFGGRRFWFCKLTLSRRSSRFLDAQLKRILRSDRGQRWFLYAILVLSGGVKLCEEHTVYNWNLCDSDGNYVIRIEYANPIPIKEFSLNFLKRPS